MQRSVASIFIRASKGKIVRFGLATFVLAMRRVLMSFAPLAVLTCMAAAYERDVVTLCLWVGVILAALLADFATSPVLSWRYMAVQKVADRIEADAMSRCVKRQSQQHRHNAPEAVEKLRKAYMELSNLIMLDVFGSLASLAVPLIIVGVHFWQAGVTMALFWLTWLIVVAFILYPQEVAAAKVYEEAEVDRERVARAILAQPESSLFIFDQLQQWHESTQLASLKKLSILVRTQRSNFNLGQCLITLTYLALVGAAFWFGTDMLGAAIVSVYMISIIMVARSTIQTCNSFAKQMGSAKSALSIYEEEETVRREVCETPSPEGFSLNGVICRYPDGTEVRIATLNIAEGTEVSVVGPSGAGKTTMLKLLARLIDPHAGSITCGGQSIHDMPREQYVAKIGMLFQDPYVYEAVGTVRDYLRLYAPSATDEEYREALTEAQLWYKLKSGLNSPLELSGGEKQRLAAAALLLRMPNLSLLLLDEPSSALDSVTEQEVMRALRAGAHRCGVSIVTVSHRLHDLADRIVVMEGGEVVDIGTHDELMVWCQTYQELIEASKVSER